MINSMIKESEINQIEALPLDYGVDYEGPLPDNELGTVCIPETLCPLDEDNIEQFMGQVDTTSYLMVFEFNTSFIANKFCRHFWISRTVIIIYSYYNNIMWVFGVYFIL